VKTGEKPPGGKREGAGRPTGANLTLEYGEVKALKAMNLRVPETASEEVKFLAERATQRIIHVMEEKVSPLIANNVLRAATWLREETCGVLATRLEHGGTGGGPVIVEIRKYNKAEPLESDLPAPDEEESEEPAN
jgi:hypothetical protein